MTRTKVWEGDGRARPFMRDAGAMERRAKYFPRDIRMAPVAKNIICP